jgi:hypothetical protein
MENQWQEFCATLQRLGDELLRAAPDDLTRAEGAAYLARLAAGAIQRNLMGTERLTDGIDFNQPRIGGYNPDYRLGVANVQAGQLYRLSGRVHDAHRLGLGIYSLAPDGGMVIDDYRVLMAGNPGLAPDGAFDLEIGPDATPETGLRSLPATNVFIVREILLKQGGKRADIALTKQGGSPGAGDSLSIEALEHGMTGAQRFFTGALKQFLGWSNIFSTQTNTIVPLLPELDKKVQGDPGTSYYTGYYRLRDDQALVVEIPAMTADYWSLMLANHWQEPLPASFLNHRTAKMEADGTARIVIAPRNPGGSNWLPTAGRSCGVIWHRRINSSNRESPRCTLRGGAQ